MPVLRALACALPVLQRPDESLMQLDTEKLGIPEVLLIKPRRHADSRGYFVETYNRKAFEEAGIEVEFVQDNQSLSLAAGTIRGLHFQSSPFEQNKLVRVVRGRIFDVAVDIRPSSPTFGKFVCAELSAENGYQILVPTGFAHGFCTLEPKTEVVYKVDKYYSATHDSGIRWNDPSIGIAWPFDENAAILSDRDRVLPFLADARDLPLNM
jgi:dTDP-4-dehydrorhamnose 3,5-epimerase